MKHLDQSGAMRLLRSLGRDRLAWSLRRLHVPVPADALVLEVGSGGNPYPRANVLLDAYLNTRERHYAKLVVDRPTVLAPGERMPFRDGAFDFVIASHVLEHSADPARFLGELQRVASAGYIETPHAILEWLCPYRDHRLEVSLTSSGELEVRGKRPSPERDRVDAHASRMLKPSHQWNRLLRHDPFSFHVRYYWSTATGGIRCKLSETDDLFQPPPGGGESPAALVGVPTLRSRLVGAVRWLASQGRRNRSIDLSTLLVCGQCSAGGLEAMPSEWRCRACGKAYRRLSPLLVAT